MADFGPLSWLDDLEPDERETVASELADAMLGYWWDKPIDEVLSDFATVIAEWQQISQVTDRLRPSDVITLKDIEGAEPAPEPLCRCGHPEDVHAEQCSLCATDWFHPYTPVGGAS